MVGPHLISILNRGICDLLSSVVASGLGNSLESLSVLAILQTTFLIAGLLHIAILNENQKDAVPGGKEKEEKSAVGSQAEAPRVVKLSLYLCPE